MLVDRYYRKNISTKRLTESQKFKFSANTKKLGRYNTPSSIK